MTNSKLIMKIVRPNVIWQEESDYEVIEPLPSYGRGRDTDGGRFISLLFGSNLTDVVITG